MIVRQGVVLLEERAPESLAADWNNFWERILVQCSAVEVAVLLKELVAGLVRKDNCVRFNNYYRGFHKGVAPFEWGIITQLENFHLVTWDNRYGAAAAGRSGTSGLICELANVPVPNEFTI